VLGWLSPVRAPRPRGAGAGHSLSDAGGQHERWAAWRSAPRPAFRRSW